MDSLSLNMDEHGVEIFPRVVQQNEVNGLIDEISALQNTVPVHGLRNADKNYPAFDGLPDQNYFDPELGQYSVGMFK